MGTRLERRVHVVAGTLAMVLASYWVAEATRSRATAVCQVRYPAPTRLTLARSDGTPLAPAELQARIGAGERGILDHARIVRDSGSAPVALAVALPDDGGEPTVAFDWAPGGMGQATAACLSYGLLLPVDFDFAGGGTLPGFAVAPDTAVPLVWTATGQIGVDLSALGGDEGLRLPARTAPLPRGRWIAIEAEAVVGTGTAHDGQFRLWVDGHLLIERTDVAWPAGEPAGLIGVHTAIGRRLGTRTATSPGRTVTLAPPQVAWRRGAPPGA